jgi:NCAIR mutase (PurE)-related protein
MNLDIILKQYKNGEIDLSMATKEINNFLYIKQGNLVVDTFRSHLVGFPEFIYGMNKTAEQLIEIAGVYLEKQLNFICTKISEEKMKILQKKYPFFEYIPEANFVRNIIKPCDKIPGNVSILTGGLTDIRVAIESYETLKTLAIDVTIYSDIGIAGIHRLFDQIKDIEKGDVLIVIAGMEGALPSIIGGLSYKPVIAVPTSTGYGASLEGFTALFSMLTSCANGITVVNIDNGFGAAIAAFRILNTSNKKTCKY